MAEANSRIPKLATGRLKRPSANKPPFVEKRPWVEMAPAASRASGNLRRLPSATSLNNVAGFSDSAKRVALMPSHSQNTVSGIRGSMPVKKNVIHPTAAQEGMFSRATQESTTVKTTDAATPKKATRAVWDLRGRMQDMEKDFVKSQTVNKDLRGKLELYNQRIAILEQANNQLQKDVEIKSVQSDEVLSMMSELRKKLRNKEKGFLSIVEDKDNSIQELKHLNGSLQKQINKLNDELEASQDEISSFRCTISNVLSSRSCIQAQLDATRSLLLQELQNTRFLLEGDEALKLELRNKNDIINSQECKLRDGESVKRRLRNVIQELKGNISVFCRVRPVPLDSIKADSSVHIVCRDQENNKCVEIPPNSDSSLTKSTKSKNTKYQEFSFDHVFDSASSQAVVFEEISQLVQSVLDGYNVCIFAYGPTGSGKTYTMEGPESISDFVVSSEDPLLGMIPRSVQQIFQRTEELVSKGWQYRIEVSCLEIYNETIRDLLTDSSNTTGAKSEVKMGSKGQDGYVLNMTTIEVFSARQVYGLLKKAKVNRSVAVTLCNERSSRSHYVFEMKLSGRNSVTTESCESILNLVDLAGSERVTIPGSAGERLTESKNINESLSNLGNVIMALSQKAYDVPFRNSKLTHLLMNSLSYNCKILMFVNINPSEEHMPETLNSLRFATKVNLCNIRNAQKRVK